MQRHLKSYLMALAVSALMIGCATSSESPRTYEYRVIQGGTDSPQFEQKLNEAAREGFTILSTTLVPKEEGRVQQAMVILHRVKR